MRWIATVVGLAAFSFALASPLRAQDDAAVEGARARADVEIDAGKRLYRELDFAACADAMRAALDLPGISPAQRLEAYEYLASALIVLDREAEASTALEAMFRLDPYHRVREPSGSPKIAEFVARLRVQFASDAALDAGVRIHAELPETARVDEPVPVRVRAECESDECPSVEEVTLLWRPDDDASWSDGPLDPTEDPNVFVGEVPSPDAVGRLLLYAEARDGSERMLARAGEPLTPLELPIRDARRQSGPRLTWLWVAIAGVVVAGAVTGLAVAFSGGEQASPGTLPPGRVELP